MDSVFTGASVRTIQNLNKKSFQLVFHKLKKKLDTSIRNFYDQEQETEVDDPGTI